MSFFPLAKRENVERERQMFKTGMVIKREKGGGIERLRPAALRDASLDGEGFYLKVDLGDDAQGRPVQIYLGLNLYDVIRVVTEWGMHLQDRERIKEMTGHKDLGALGLNILVVAFHEDETYQAIVEEAEALGVAPAEQVQQIVVDWRKKKEGGHR